jgi:XRE family aerobic/anaerobic benzoate catabolism transcriptional regulator
MTVARRKPRSPSRVADPVLVQLGERVRDLRAIRGMSRKTLARDAGVSERFLADLESGVGNASILLLTRLAQALALPVTDLLGGARDQNTNLARSMQVLTRLSPERLEEAHGLLRARFASETESEQRSRHIALIGLRGAGKSTLGKALADKLGVPFIELNRMVEQQYGASVPLLIEMSGLATFRRHERTCLERVIAENERAVIATAGGIVSNPESYALLLRRTHTVWISARPEEHMMRVMRQGDFRPMAKNREAMADLVAILDARKRDYARAEASLDTSGATVEQSLAKLNKIVSPWLKS